MNLIPLGTSGLNVSQIAYGCMTIGGEWGSSGISEETQHHANVALDTALEQGINFFDHADIYTKGKSEEVFSNWLNASPSRREQVYIQTKCGIYLEDEPEQGFPGRYDFSYEHIIQSVEGSLRRLKTDYLDVLLLHRPDPLVEPEEVARAFDDLHESGKVHYFGVSNHTAAQISLLQKFLNQPLVANQVELNVLHAALIEAGVVFNQDYPPYPLRGDGTLEFCRQHDVTLQAWSPLAGGIATGKQAENSDESVENVTKLVAEMAKAKSVAPEAIMIAWILRHPAKIQPIIGTTQPERIQACCQATQIELSRVEWYQLFIAGRGSDMP